MGERIEVFSNDLGSLELAAVERVFASRWLGRGRECAALERELAAFLGVERVLLTSTCTAATQIGLRCLGLPRGAGVIVPSVHFVAAATAVVDMGLRPLYADVDRARLTVLPEEIERLRGHAQAMMLLHYGGHPAPRAIWEAADGLAVLEDAANCIAARDWEGRAVGTRGACGVWSFDAMKELVMGDGGALWLADPERYELAEALRYLGLAPAASSGQAAAQAGAGRWWEYDVLVPAGRHISNDILAAIGRVQLARLVDNIIRRARVWGLYQEGLAGVGDLRLPPDPEPGCLSGYYLYWVQTEQRDALAHHLLEREIYTTYRYYPLHLVPSLSDGTVLPNAEWVAAHTLNLPLHQNLSDDQVARVIETVREYYRGA